MRVWSTYHDQRPALRCNNTGRMQTMSEGKTPEVKETQKTNSHIRDIIIALGIAAAFAAAIGGISYFATSQPPQTPPPVVVKPQPKPQPPQTPPPTDSADKRFESLIERYQTQELSGDYPAAVQTAKLLLNHTQNTYGKDSFETGIVLFLLAVTEIAQGNFQGADSKCKKALKIYKKEFGARHPIVARPLNCLSQYNIEKENYAEALRLSNKAVKIAEKARIGSDERVVLWEALVVQGKVLILTEKYAQGIAAGLKASRIAEALQGKNSFQYGNAIAIVGEGEFLRGNFKKALVYYNKALAVADYGNHPASEEIHKNLDTLNEFKNNRTVLGNKPMRPPTESADLEVAVYYDKGHSSFSTQTNEPKLARGDYGTFTDSRLRRAVRLANDALGGEYIRVGKFNSKELRVSANGYDRVNLPVRAYSFSDVSLLECCEEIKEEHKDFDSPDNKTLAFYTDFEERGVYMMSFWLNRVADESLNKVEANKNLDLILAHEIIHYFVIEHHTQGTAENASCHFHEDGDASDSWITEFCPDDISHFRQQMGN